MHLPFQYGKTRNFCGLRSYTTQPYVVLGAPYDGATTFRSGSRFGPNAIRDASQMLTDGVHSRFPHTLEFYVGDAGDMPLPTGNTEKMLETVTACHESFKDKHIVTMGGDHSVTLGILRSLAKTHGKMALIHFDAHNDTWSDHFGEPHGHGTWLYHAIEENLISAQNTISIGVRSPSDPETAMWLNKKGGRTMSARQAMRCEPTVLRDIIAQITGPSMPCYLSLDIDCLDPAYAPGTGTPEIGGLTTVWLAELLETLERFNLIGMDCMEVAPAYDPSGITALAAATFCWQYISMQIARQSHPK
jgi:agmatinase